VAEAPANHPASPHKGGNKKKLAPVDNAGCRRYSLVKNIYCLPRL